MLSNALEEISCSRYGKIRSRFTKERFNVVLKMLRNIVELVSWNVDHHFPLNIVTFKLNPKDENSDYI